MDRERILKINEMIGKVKDKHIFKQIFYLSQTELQSSGECKYSHNNNGIFFDLKNLSFTTLEKIEELVKQSISTNVDSETLNYSSYFSDEKK
jgi:hypothetical protein